MFAAEKLHRRDAELASLLAFVRSAHATKLGNYSGRNIDYIVRLLYADADSDDNERPSQANVTVLTVAAHTDLHGGTHTTPHNDDDEPTHNIAHGLHCASIAMLGVLVLEVSRQSPIVISAKRVMRSSQFVRSLVVCVRGMTQHVVDRFRRNSLSGQDS